METMKSLSTTVVPSNICVAKSVILMYSKKYTLFFMDYLYLMYFIDLGIQCLQIQNWFYEGNHIALDTL
jgi:hypothetical protein